jgi:hypothetical protein
VVLLALVHTVHLVLQPQTVLIVLMRLARGVFRVPLIHQIARHRKDQPQGTVRDIVLPAIIQDIVLGIVLLLANTIIVEDIADKVDHMVVHTEVQMEVLARTIALAHTVVLVHTVLVPEVVIMAQEAAVFEEVLVKDRMDPKRQTA